MAEQPRDRSAWGCGVMLLGVVVFFVYTTMCHSLFEAVERQNPRAVVKLLAAGRSPNDWNKDGEMPLQLAVRKGDVGIARLLLENGADVNAQDRTGRTPLHEWAVCPDQGDELLRALVTHGGDPEAKDRAGNTPLHTAVLGHDHRRASLLLQHGANVNARNTEGNTPLHVAYDSETASLLLQHGANVNARNTEGKTPLHACLDEWSLLSNRRETVSLLLRCGADVKATDRDGNTPLHLAADGFRIEASGDEYGTVEMEGVDSFRTMVELLERGSPVNARNRKGDSPLHLALRNSFGLVDPDGSTYLCVWLLLKYGADPKARNNRGETPLSLSSRSDAPAARELVPLLRRPTVRGTR